MRRPTYIILYNKKKDVNENDKERKKENGCKNHIS